MAKIVGQDGTGWSNLADTPQNSGGEAVWKATGYTPAFNGNATTAYINIPDWSSSTRGKVLVYRASDGVLLATSTEFLDSQGNGLLSRSITLNGITTGVDLKLAWLTESYCQVIKNNGASNYDSNQDAMTYASPDDPLPAGTNLGPEFIIWLDGSAAGGNAGGKLAGSRDPIGGLVGGGLVARGESGLLVPRRRDVIVPSIHAAMRRRNFTSEARL